MSSLAPLPSGSERLAALLASTPEDLRDAVRAAWTFASAARAASTTRAYRSSWEGFVAWCAGHNLPPMPASPQSLALYCSELAQAGRKWSTISRVAAAITAAHVAAGHPTQFRKDAMVHEVLSGIARTIGTAVTKKRPISAPELRKMIASAPTGPRGWRDKALLTVWWAGAFRRSEVMALDRCHVELLAEGMRVTVARSKTDQTGEGRVVGIAYSGGDVWCPVRLMQRWLTCLQHYGFDQGPIFRPISPSGQISETRLSDKGAARIVKAYAASVGIDPARVGGHSLRAGFVTAAARMGQPERNIMRQTGHKRMDTLKGYIRDANLFDEGNPSIGALDGRY